MKKYKISVLKSTDESLYNSQTKKGQQQQQHEKLFKHENYSYEINELQGLQEKEKSF